jgi:GWxTD domain-containing protein
MRILIYLYLICSIVLGQLPVIPVDLDYACFKGSEKETYTEVYISFFQKDLLYQSQDNTTEIGKFTKEIKIFKGDSLYVNLKRDYQSIVAKDEVRSGYASFIDVFAFNIQSGSYTLHATITDNLSLKKGDFQMDMEIPFFSTSLALSHIEIATKIEQADQPSNFSGKNNIAIYPCASQTFSIMNPMLNFYFEAYNLELSNTGQNSYSYAYTITDTEEHILRSDTSRVKSTAANLIAEAKGINIITLPSGIYFLNVELTDHISGQKTSARKRFNLYKPDKKTSELATSGYVEENIYINFTKEELQQEFEIAKYIASANEIKIYKSLDDAASMGRFLANFWKKRDTDASTQENEFRKIYLDRYKFVETNYTTPFRKGWQSDKGRITLIYGKPDEIERFQNTIDTQPYEIWHYYAVEGGVYFIFADMDGMGDIQLLHSTARREIKDNNWQLKISKVDSDNQFDNINNQLDY